MSFPFFRGAGMTKIAKVGMREREAPREKYCTNETAQTPAGTGLYNTRTA